MSTAAHALSCVRLTGHRAKFHCEPPCAKPISVFALTRAGNFWRHLGCCRPTMDGFVHKFAASQGQQGWVPTNSTTGSLASGNLYTPFYEFDGDATKAGWRLSGDESSEVVFVLKDNYSAPTPSFVAGNNDGFSSLITMTQLTYLNAPAVATRDIYSNGTFIDLPFTSHTVLIGKESIDNGSKKCAMLWNFTATVVTADGTTSFFSTINTLIVPVPSNTPSTITLGNTFDPGFSAVVSFSAETPFLYARGSSSQIGNITLTQEFYITFCPEDG
ncbi:hypothetical protein B0H17DRAFT_1207268 [Mycena rosella]|uniref:Uncharacterized protein n=1 Tax=Mycena rosella TaxID=1033263 RepID=A0AAD7GAP4_MYCRO|nr:hypothetical protein B0H17DRAFT_1207268 [Mycena rosella]